MARRASALPVEALRELAVPRTTLQTLVRRGIVELSEEAAEFHMSGLKPRKLEFLFTPAQKTALETITTAAEKRKFLPMLLHGVTGSGKTAVYLSAMQAVLAKGRSAILLVPEIGLTPAMAADLHQIFGDEVAILHSALSDDERAEQWKRIRNGESHIVVGTRSAIFAPVPDLALIVVDEEHDHSYKQEEMPRYHARDVAVMRAKMCNAAVVLGLGHAIAGDVLQRGTRQIQAAGIARAHREAAAARKSKSSTCARNFSAPRKTRSSRASWWRRLASGWRVTNR